MHRTLEAVASRLAPPEHVLAAERPAAAAGAIPSEPAPDETGPIRLGAAIAPTIPALPDEKARSLTAGEADVPPEPGADGPHGPLPAPDRPGTADPAVNDIKAGLIAAARRAAQSCGEPQRRTSREGSGLGPRSPSRAATPPARASGAPSNATRRPLILGLAALVLAIGALQIGSRAARETGTAVAVPPSLEPKPTLRPPSETKPPSPVGTVRPEGARKVEAPTGREAPAFSGPEDAADALAPFPVQEWTHAGPRPKKATGARA